MAEQLNILVVEDCNADFLMVKRHLKQNGLSACCRRVGSLDGLNEAVHRDNWDLVLAAYSVPQLNFHEGLHLVQAELPEVPVIMVTGTVGEEKAVEILKLGVRDFVLKDNLARLVPAIERSLKDATERRVRVAAEEALRQSEERLSLAMRGANDGLWDWYLKTGELYCSPRWKSMLGYADDELVSSYGNWERLLHPQDVAPALTHLHNFLEGRISRYEVEFRMRHKEGHYVDILSRAFLLYDDQGEAVRMAGTHVDVTERKRLEEENRQAQKMEAVGQLTGGVAHDFNNILSAINGFSYLILEQEQVSGCVKSYVEEIMAASQRAAALNVSLMAFSRKQAVNLAVIDLGCVLAGFEDFIRRMIREDIELKIICANEPLAVMADQGQIEQVLMNLVTNARDAMPEGGNLLMETLPITLDQAFVESRGLGNAGAYAVISVCDSGLGMDKETQTRIFEPFFTTKELGKGTGLGLSMAYGIVKKHDGFINVYSEPGTGTTFRIYLPRVQTMPQAVKTEPKDAAPLRGGAETILVCEDDAALRRLATRVLSHHGYKVIEAVDGQDAIDRFIEFSDSIQLAIIDLLMPKKNGKAACDEMKMLRPGLKAIFTSGYARDLIDQYKIVDEHTDFIHKPISPNELVAKVREMLDKE